MGTMGTPAFIAILKFFGGRGGGGAESHCKSADAGSAGRREGRSSEYRDHRGAHEKTPPLKGMSRPLRERVPSGKAKMPTPFFR